MANGGEDGVGGVTGGSLEIAASEVALSLHMADHGLDGGGAAQFALDGAEHAAHGRNTASSRAGAAAVNGSGWRARVASLIATCKMNGVDPQAYLADVLTRIVDRHPMSRLDQLLPFAYVKTETE